jgi:hypothetical protein
MVPGHYHFLSLALYIGPDVLMPLATALTAIVGFFLLFWRRTVSLARRASQAATSVARRALGTR